MDPDALTALLDGTRLFLARHEEALASGDPERALDACAGLLLAVQETIPAEVDAAAHRGADGPAGPSSALHPEDDLARRVLARRLSECEGLVLQLQLAFRNLEKRNVDPFRLVALLTAVRRSLRGVAVGLELWAHARGAPAPDGVVPHEALRAAREALLANVPEAATPALRAALRAGLAAPVGLPARTPAKASLARWAGGALRFDPLVAQGLDDELAEGADAVRGWDRLTRVEAVLDGVGMSRPRS